MKDHIDRLESDQTIALDNTTAMRVQGIEKWIEKLLPAQHVNSENQYDLLRMVDPETGALFFVAKLKEIE